MNADRWAYLDSSALVKLVVEEAESAALRGYMLERQRRTSSALAGVEVILSARPHGAGVVQYARDILAQFDLIPVEQAILDAAADLDIPRLRALDAIHIATARSISAELDALVTYDGRMTQAAQSLNLPVAAPR